MLKYPKSYEQILALLDILKCENCGRSLHVPFCNGVCDHVLCDSCCSKSATKGETVCPICAAPYRPMDVQEHVQYSSLLVTTRRIAKLLTSKTNKENAIYPRQNSFNVKVECHDVEQNDAVISKPVPLKLSKVVNTPVTRRSDKSKDELLLKKAMKVPIASPENSHLTDVSTLQNEVRRSGRRSLAEKGTKKAKNTKKSLEITRVKHRVNEKGETILHKAAIKNDLALAKLALKDGIDVNSRDNAGWTPLHEASLRGHIDVVKCLLSNGANVNLPAGPDLETPLSEAITNSCVDVCKLLLENGANPCIENVNSQNCYYLIDNIMRDFQTTAKLSSKKKTLNQEVLMRYEKIQKLLGDHLYENGSGKTPAASNEKSGNAINKREMKCAASVAFVEKRRLKPVLLASGINRTQRGLLNKVAIMLHAQVVNNFSSDVTHLIIQSSSGLVHAGDKGKIDLTLMQTCPRSMKFLSAVLQGCWIISFEWVEQCAYLKQKVEEECFEISGCSRSSIPLAPQRARLARESGQNGLFYGWRMCFLGLFSYTMPSKDELICLTRIGGASVYQRDVTTGTLLASIAVEVNDQSTSIMFNESVNISLAKTNAQPLSQCPIVWEKGDETSISRTKIAEEGLVKKGTVDKGSFLIVVVPVSNSSFDASVLELCHGAVKMLKPRHNVHGLKDCIIPPLRIVTAKWIMDCVANYKILDLTDEHLNI